MKTKRAWLFLIAAFLGGFAVATAGRAAGLGSEAIYGAEMGLLVVVILVWALTDPDRVGHSRG